MLAQATSDPMRAYRARKDAAHRSVVSQFTILGFISSGTYGRVYSAVGKDDGRTYAIKKFKPEKDTDPNTYNGLSQSAIREISINREISHENVTALRTVILEDKSIYMVFEYADHDFLQVINHHLITLRSGIPTVMLKSLAYQLLNGLFYLHNAFILHRDLKPANILLTSGGVVKIGDLGLARIAHQPLQRLTKYDKVVVTVWYRAPELLLGAHHYHKAVDIWAVGCVLAELASLRVIFKGKEVKNESGQPIPFQLDQIVKIVEVLGTPDALDWPGIIHMPDYPRVANLDFHPKQLTQWCQGHNCLRSLLGTDMLKRLLEWDPDVRITADEALRHEWFTKDPKPSRNVFHAMPESQCPPPRRWSQNDVPSMIAPTLPASWIPPHSRLEADRV